MTMPQKDEPGYSAYDGCAETGRGQTTQEAFEIIQVRDIDYLEWGGEWEERGGSSGKHEYGSRRRWAEPLTEQGMGKKSRF